MDLPDRLREASGWRYGFESPFPDLLREAADELERLQREAAEHAEQMRRYGQGEGGGKIAALRARLIAADQHLASNRIALDSYWQENGELRAEVERLQQKVADRDATLSVFHRAVDDLRARLAAYQPTIDALAGYIDGPATWRPVVDAWAAVRAWRAALEADQQPTECPDVDGRER